MGTKNNLPTVVADWLAKQFPMTALGERSELVEVCRPASSIEIERIVDIAHGDQCNKPFEIHVLYPLVTQAGDVCTSDENEPAYFLVKLGATYKLVLLDITDHTQQTLRVLNYKKFKGLTNVNG